MAGPMVGPLVERLGLDAVEMYWTPDGEFPDHEPNPLLPENRELIIDRVRSEKADLGIAWDGDADRCFFIDGRGEFVDGDFLTALIAAQVLSRDPGATILYDVRASRAVPDTVARLGGTSHVNRVGHAFFKIGMREHGAAFGGEVSGHYYFREFWSADSGTLPALFVLELLSKESRPLAELVDELRSKYFISGEINSEVADQQAKMEEIAAAHAGRGDLLARRRLGRLPRLALQRPPLEHRAPPAPQPREPRVARGHGAQARRGLGPHSLVNPEEALARAAEAGIHRLRIPTPFAVGRVNCYLIEDNPLTLVDTGPNSGKALDELQGQLADRGHSIDDLELVILTHQHIDHLGLVEIIVEHSGAEVAALGLAARRLANFSEDAELDDEFSAAPDAPQRDSRERGDRPPGRLAELPGLGLARPCDAAARRTAR